MSYARGVRLAWARSLVTAVLALAGCAEPTQLVVVVRTDMTVPTEIDQVRVRVLHVGDATPTYDNTVPLTTPSTAGVTFQTLLSFGAGPRDDDASRRVHVLVDAMKGGSRLFTTEVRTGFARGKKLRLEVYLARRCLTQAEMCLPDQTCGLSGCVSPDVPVEVLPPADSPPTITPVDPRPLPTAGTLPRLLRPLSLATATTQRPTLRFALHPDADKHIVSITPLRPTGTMVLPMVIAAPADFAVPGSDLAPGPYLWHVEARSGTTTVAQSATWELFVPRYTAADRAWGTLPDLNLDGLGDLVVASPQHVEVYLGGGDLASPVPDAVLHPVIATSGAHAILSVDVGDVNGDGYGDVVVGVMPASGGELVVYWGGTGGVSEEASQHVPLSGTGTAADVAMAGDTDGDGYGDVLLGEPGVPPSGSGQVVVVRGGASAVSPDLTTTVSSPDSTFGSLVSALGPVDATGRDAFVAGSTTLGLLVYVGTDSSPVYSPVPLRGPPFTIAPAGDIQRNGLPTLLVAYDPVGAVAEIAGPGAFPALSWSGMRPEDWGASIASAGDFDGDGANDPIIGAPATDGGDGKAIVFFSGSIGVGVVYGSPSSAERAGASVAGIGDFDGDGLDDVAVGAPDANGLVGQVYVQLGVPVGDTPLPPFAIEPVEPLVGFGFAIASR